ncbi:MAG: HK97 family phage prohead protease [Planctomycetota bacterium]
MKYARKSAPEDPKVHKGRTVAGMMTAEAVDEEGEVLVAAGLDTGYMEKAGALLFNHDSNKPIGKVRRIEPRADADGRVTGWYASCAIADTQLGEECLTLADMGALHYSVGFLRVDAGPPTDEEKSAWPDCDYVTRKWRMHELSLTPIPANSEALVDSVKKAVKLGELRYSTYEMLRVKEEKTLGLVLPPLRMGGTLGLEVGP